MADATKQHIAGNEGTFFVSEIKTLFSILKSKRTMAFAYGVMFAFVVFTAFLAFNPSPNSSSPWFSNIFSVGSSPSSDRSHFSSVLSFFFPNNSSSRQQREAAVSNSSSITQTNFTRSISGGSESPPGSETYSVAKNTTFQSPVKDNSKNQTQTGKISDKPVVLLANQTMNSSRATKQPLAVKNQTINSQNPTNPPASKQNQTTIPSPKSPLAAVNQSEKSISKGVSEKGLASNYTSSLSKKQSNVTDAAVSAKQGIENWMQSLMNCDFFDGEWVMDDSYPLYKPGSCKLIDEQFNCILNGRPDTNYQKYKWKPKGCSLPRFNGAHMLELLRGKRLVFVGDSLNRNMWESLVCILKGSVKDRSKVFEAHGRQVFRGEAEYSFIFKDYNFTVEFFVSPFLVQEWEYAGKDGIKKETLRLDLVGRSSDQYKGAEIIIFNTGHWWTHDKTAKGKDYYQEGSHIYNELNVLEAFRKALTTWARWVDANINPEESLVFFRGYSASHFSGGQWNSGGACDSETEPIKNETYLTPYPSKMVVLEKVLKGMKTHVTYLNITRLTDYRKDGHPSVYRKQNLPEEERRSPLRFQDCSHWCLPGVPDSWNELFYAELLVKESKMRQHQRRS